MADELQDGRLLVATPGLLDPNFFRTVVLLCRYDPLEGGVGLVLNRCSGMPVGKALSELPLAQGRQEPLWLGGPVEGRNLWVLHRRRDLVIPGHQVQDGVYFTADGDVVKKILRTNGPDLDGSVFRLFVGYSGWAVGQLEHELEEGAWISVPAGPECIFADRVGSLWREMIIRAHLPDARRPEIIAGARLN